MECQQPPDRGGSESGSSGVCFEKMRESQRERDGGSRENEVAIAEDGELGVDDIRGDPSSREKSLSMLVQHLFIFFLFVIFLMQKREPTVKFELNCLIY